MTNSGELIKNNPTNYIAQGPTLSLFLSANTVIYPALHEGIEEGDTWISGHYIWYAKEIEVIPLPWPREPWKKAPFVGNSFQGGRKVREYSGFVLINQKRTMLSREQNHIYWLGRYLERGREYARFIYVIFNLMQDLPSIWRRQWKPLRGCTGDLIYIKNTTMDLIAKKSCSFSFW